MGIALIKSLHLWLPTEDLHKVTPKRSVKSDQIPPGKHSMASMVDKNQLIKKHRGGKLMHLGKYLGILSLIMIKIYLYMYEIFKEQRNICLKSIV